MQKVYQKESVVRSYFPVITYASLTDYLSQVQSGKDELHVFTTNSLSQQIRERSHLFCDGFEGLYQKLFLGFFNVQTQIFLQSQCRKRIINGAFVHQEYLLDRLPAIVDAFYFLADLGVHELSYSFEDRRKNEITTLINYILQEPLYEEYTRLKANYQQNDIARILRGTTELNKIIFYEIDSINFRRMNLIHWLKAKGFQIEFRIPYQPEYKNLYRFWENVYKVITRKSIETALNYSLGDAAGGQRLGCFYENKGAEGKERQDIEIYEFETPYDFSFYAENTEDRLVAVNPEEILPLVENSKTPLYEDEIGSFIYFIQFCRIEDEKIYLSFETLSELITSSWIHTKNVEGRKTLSLLIDLQEYMSGVQTIDDIKMRLGRLLDLETVSQSFDRENSEDAGRNRMKRYILNPFRTFSFLNQDRYQVTINQLLELVELTEKICRYLILERNETINVNEYFKRWENIYDKQIEETDKNRQWKQIMTKKYPDHWEFATEELLQLLYLNISAVTEKEKKIKPLSAVQEIILEREQSGSLHLTNMTQMNFPESRFASIPDFFTYTELKELIQSVPHNKPFLHSLWVDYTMVQSFEELGMYRLYTLLRDYRGPIQISWIKNLQEDGYRNMILDILADLYCEGDIRIYDAEQQPMLFQNEPEAYEENESHDAVKQIEGKIPDLFWLDHDFCSKKFFLTAIIEQQQVYETDFHHRLLFSKIGRLFSFSKEERLEFRRLIFPLFPHWTDTLKENLIDTEISYQFRKYKTFENISYPKEMNGLHLLRSVNRENRRTKARNRYRKDRGFNDEELLKQFSENISDLHVKAEPGNHCKMCPHLSSCVEGMYSIDGNH